MAFLVLLVVGLFLWQSNNHLARRTLALSTDLIPFQVFGFMLSSTGDINAYPNTLAELFLPLHDPLSVTLLYAIPVFYGTLMECSKYRATGGKLLFRIIVGNNNGSQPTLISSLLRNLAKWTTITISPLFVLNSLLVYFSGRGIHDHVIKGFVAPLPKGSKRKIGQVKVYPRSLGPKLDFKDHEDAGAYGETLLTKELEKLSKTVIYSYGSTDNLVYARRNFEIDSYALVQGVGLLLLEAKFYSGEIYPTAFDQWDNIKGNVNSPKDNPCRQLARTKEVLTGLLESYGMNRWPIYPAVVFTSPSSIVVRNENSKPQLPVLDLVMLSDWIQALKNDPSISFSNKDVEQIKGIFKKHEKEYRPFSEN